MEVAGERSHWGDGKPRVLLVAGAAADERALAEGFADRPVSTTVLTDGREAIAHLTAASEERTDGRLPDLVVLDLGVESPDGLTILDAIKSSPVLGTVPVVVLTAEPEAVGSAYELGANAHVSKPSDQTAYAAAAESAASFWCDWAQLPPERLCTDRSLSSYD